MAIQKILVVDDSKTELYHLSELLGKRGYTVRTAEKEHIYDGALSDLEQKYAHLFVRVHRNALVARRCVRAVEKHNDPVEGEGWTVRLDGCDERLAVSRRQLMLRGWAINAVNPKGTVFMLAVVPQFLDLARPLLPQYAVIAATLVFTDLVVMAVYTLMAARVLRALRAEAQVRWMNRVFGGMLMGMAALLATFKRSL